MLSPKSLCFCRRPEKTGLDDENDFRFGELGTRMEWNKSFVCTFYDTNINVKIGLKTGNRTIVQYVTIAVR